jgi:hypothetical protein
MYKVLRSYSRKAERKHEVSGGSTSQQQQQYYAPQSQQYGVMGSPMDAARNGQVVPAIGQPVNVGAWDVTGTGGRQRFSESSNYETHEHYERKVQRVKKTRSERDGSRNRKKVTLHHFVFFNFLVLPLITHK